ncbi:hypothetical protein GCM10010172_24680 [Paractinoplanes ferrugineus]|uniref:Uncharacterized protein n=1 Tax=Paractinoplanes ferrugineus TaxID=113564 RepID=A0A919IV47_9ACTN|nr:hypothetical protein [Actinoplanes ferrugineus]GIE08622.1 hypothetical protein Afe05nite_04620 [Actinoplanes ferrugineus]
MIPEEDRGPAWLRDYGYTDFSQIEADIQAMEQFATGLSAIVKDDYAPHLSTVTDAMSTRLPDPPSEFIELLTFLFAHNQAQDIAHQNVYNFANGTQEFAVAAQDISKRYDGSDAFSHAKVNDVDKAFQNVTSLDGSTPAEGNA